MPDGVVNGDAAGEMERWFRQCTLTTETKMMRAVTRKSNIRYRVVKVGQQQEMEDEIVDIVTRKTEGMQDNDKGMAEKQRQEVLKR
jgi:hypothetical protein